MTDDTILNLAERLRGLTSSQDKDGCVDRQTTREAAKALEDQRAEIICLRAAIYDQTEGITGTLLKDHNKSIKQAAPVAWQYRPKRGADKGWRDCSKENFDMLEGGHDVYETRALYTAPLGERDLDGAERGVLAEEPAERMRLPYSTMPPLPKPWAGQKEVLSYSGGGKVSVPVANIVGSEKVQRQVAAVKKIEAHMAGDKPEPTCPVQAVSALPCPFCRKYVLYERGG